VLALALLTSTIALACPGLANRVDAPPAAQQLITVQSPEARSTHAELRTWRRSGKCWLPAAGPFPARVGWNGISANRHEGDGTTPAGIFGIGATMYGNSPNPGVRFRYRRLRCGDWWNEDARSRTYNTFQHVPCGRTPPFKTTTPGMWESPRAYPFLAVVEFNMRPTVPGRGSGIFLHAQTGGATNGCVSLRRGDLVTVLRWLRPAADPVIAIRAD